MINLKKINDSAWNEALSKAGPQGTIFQSTYWADYLKKIYNDRPLWFASFDKKGEIQGLLLAIESCYAKHVVLNSSNSRNPVYRSLYKKGIAPIFQRLLPSIYWENGPIAISNQVNFGFSSNSTLYREMLNAVIKKALADNCYSIKFARPPFFDDRPEIYSSLGFESKRMGTILINLDQPEEVLWNNIDRDCRRTVRRAVDQGVVVSKVSGLEGLQEFYGLNVQSSKRTEQKVYPFSHFYSLWDHFSPLNKLAIFVARVNDKPVAAALYLMHNLTMHIFALGDSDYVRANRIFANEALMWYVIKWAREQGFKFFDHSGVQLYKIDAGYEKARRIYEFKAKWGGSLVEYHDYQKAIEKKTLLRIVSRVMIDSTIHN